MVLKVNLLFTYLETMLTERKRTHPDSVAVEREKKNSFSVSQKNLHVTFAPYVYQKVIVTVNKIPL